MFNAKKPDVAAGPLTASAHAAPAAVASLKPFVAYSKDQEPCYSIINEWLSMRGDLESTGDILIKGKVHGNIRCRMLIIDADAQVEGGIWSEELVIRGATRGVIHAKKVRVEKSGDVDSEIFHETLSTEEGARVRGSLRNFQESAESFEDVIPSSIPEAAE
ncbi:MAG: bactofilin family protein [Hyphomicrobium sp.]